MHRALLRCLPLVAVLAWTALVAAPAVAAPDNTNSKAYHLPCDGPVCDSGDNAITENEVVTGGIQIHASSSSVLGLDALRVYARLSGSSSWICLRGWSSPSNSEYFTWSTGRWPGSSSTPPAGCPASTSAPWGDLTRNGVYEVRAWAKDSAGEQWEADPWLIFRVNNAPSIPDLHTIEKQGDTEGEPVVMLQWEAAPEPDVLEYQFIRTDPSGEANTFAVSAAKPGGQGCDRDGSTYVCFDDAFGASGYSGEYSYSVVALRSSPVAGYPCALSGANCVRSGESGSLYTSLSEPRFDSPDGGSRPTRPGSPTQSAPTGGSGSSSSSPRVRSGGFARGGGGDANGFFTGTYEKTLPYDAAPFFVGPSGSGGGGGPGGRAASFVPDDMPADDDTRRLFASIAGGLLMLLAAAHVARVLRASPPR